MGAEEHLCLGGDMDGAPMPKDMSSLSSYIQFAQKMLAHGYSEQFIHKLFFGNAYRFASTYLI